MPDDESWRSQDATAYLDRVQRAGFAWEFLRRNPDYRNDYEDMRRDVASGTAATLEAALALAQRWGLSFPVRSAAAKRPRPDIVGVQYSPGGDRTHGGAARHRKHAALRFFAIAGILRGLRRRPTPPVVGDPGRTADLDSAGCDGDCLRCRYHPLRPTPPGSARNYPSPVATPDRSCDGAECIVVVDQAAAPPPDFDAEST